MMWESLTLKGDQNENSYSSNGMSRSYRSSPNLRSAYQLLPDGRAIAYLTIRINTLKETCNAIGSIGIDGSWQGTGGAKQHGAMSSKKLRCNSIDQGATG